MPFFRFRTRETKKSIPPGRCPNAGRATPPRNLSRRVPNCWRGSLPLRPLRRGTFATRRSLYLPARRGFERARLVRRRGGGKLARSWSGGGGG
eukprot:9180651-Pyramimonas_sp.AAC.1